MNDSMNGSFSPEIKKRKETLLRLFLLCILSISFFDIWGCGKPQDQRDVLNLHLDSDPITLDPALMTDVKSGRLSALLYDTLVQYDEDLKLVPALALNWKTSEDGKTYTFYLNPGAIFTNGDGVTSEDVQFSLERLANPDQPTPRSWILSHVEGYHEYRNRQNSHLNGIHVQGNSEISITLEEPFSPFLALLSMPNASILSKKSFLENHALLGTGPFILIEWQHDYELRLKSNPRYFNGPPHLSGICFRIIKETIFVSSEFRRGRLDMIEIPSTEIPLYLKDPLWKPHIVEQQNLSLYYLGFNCKKPPLDNPELRRTISGAIDKNILINTLRKFRSVPIYGPIPVGLPGSLLRESVLDHHPAKPSSQSPVTLELLQSTNEDTLELSEAIQYQLGKAGIAIKISEQEWSAFKANLALGNFDLFLLSWWADYPDGENFLYPLFHSSNQGNGGNYTRFNDQEADKLIEQAQKTTSNEEKILLYQKIQRIILEKNPMVFLYSSTSQILKQPWIEHFTPHPLYNGNKLTKIQKRQL